MKYDIIVVGGGHAGCEASLASSRLNKKTLLITGNKENIADMPCNPSIGGPAKGIIVREIDALGGEMGKNTDKSSIQMKMLNTKKGPAVRALRAQGDKVIYPKEMIKTLESEENLEIKEAIVEDLIIEDNKVKGVVLENGEIFEGEQIGYSKETCFEIVFSTNMSGYVEVLTDPSNAGLGVVMTYPLIGNYGIMPEDFESDKVWAKAVLIHNLAKFDSNFRSKYTLEKMLRDQKVPGLTDINTRKLTRIIRDQGSMNAAIVFNIGVSTSI